MNYFSKQRIKVMGFKWNYYFFTREEYNKQFNIKHVPEEGLEVANVVAEKKEIYFNFDELDINIIVHELTHAYYSETPTASLDLTSHQLEELCCEIMERYSVKIRRQARRILNKKKKFLNKI